MATEKEYVRLPGRGWRREGIVAGTRSFCSLWMGKDHLLHVDTTGYTEQYKRLYYADIQALVFRKTNNGLIANVILGVLAVLFGLPMLGVDDAFGRGMLFFFFASFFVALLINIAFGPTCVAYAQTAVQVQELPSLRRLRTARKALRLLRPRLDAAQGAYSPDVMQAAAAAAGAAVESLPAAAAAAAGPAPAPIFRPAPVAGPAPVKHYEGRFHQVLFIMLLIDGVLGILHVLWASRVFEVINGLLTAAEIICLICAMVRQNGTDISRPIRVIVGTYVGLYVVMFIVGLAYGFMASLNGRVSLQPSENPVMMVLVLISSLCGLGLGIAGLLALKRFREEYARRMAATTAAGAPPVIG